MSVDVAVAVAIVVALNVTYTSVNPVFAGVAATMLTPCAISLADRAHDNLFLCEFSLLLGALVLGERSMVEITGKKA